MLVTANNLGFFYKVVALEHKGLTQSLLYQAATDFVIFGGAFGGQDLAAFGAINPGVTAKIGGGIGQEANP